jgi:hypothetical protein
MAMNSATFGNAPSLILIEFPTTPGVDSRMIASNVTLRLPPNPSDTSQALSS